jgi:tRNA(fMet)-specific endonuclease VapC
MKKLCYLLDTNICIYIAKHKPISVLQQFSKLKVGEVGMSIITHGELLYGIEKSQYPTKSKKILEELLTFIAPYPLTVEVSEHYAHIRAHLEKKGKPIGANDLWIAAQALTLHTTLVTNNEKEFSRIPHLKIENWVE